MCAYIWNFIINVTLQILLIILYHHNDLDKLVDVMHIVLTVNNFYIYTVTQKKVAPLQLFALFSLRLTIFH